MSLRSSGAIDGRGRDGLAPDDPDDSVFLSSDLASFDPSSSFLLVVVFLSVIVHGPRWPRTPTTQTTLSLFSASSEPSSSFSLSSSFLLSSSGSSSSRSQRPRLRWKSSSAGQHALSNSPSYVGELGGRREFRHDDLQYLGSIKSSTQDLSLPLGEIIIYPTVFSGDRGWYASEPKLNCWHVAMKAVGNTA